MPFSIFLFHITRQLRQRDFSLFTLHFSLFTKNHVVWLSCCLVVLLIERNPNCVSAIFHSSLFTKKEKCNSHSSFYILHSSFNKRMSYCQGIREEGW